MRRPRASVPIASLALVVVFAVQSLACVTLAAAVLPSSPVVTSVELVEKPDRYDEQRIRFIGEAIGSVMDRGDIAWLHLNDDAYGLAAGPRPVTLEGYNSGQAVTVDPRLAAKIEHLGSYGWRGDLVEVEGIFRDADGRYGGDMVIEASSLRIVRLGQRLRRPVARWKLIALPTLMLTAIAAFALLRLTHRATLVLPRR